MQTRRGTLSTSSKPSVWFDLGALFWVSICINGLRLDSTLSQVDNVVRNGRVADPDYSDAATEGVRSLLEYLKDDTSVEATTIATVGEKGYDGFLYALKL